jgi:hypothetical protein
MLPFVGFHLASYPPPGYHRIAGLLPNLKEVAISPRPIDTPIDAGDQLRRERTRLRRLDALGELSAVRHAEHECVDVE